MPRLVRRKPLSERILSYLNPMDFWLWASEELQTGGWDSKAVGTKLGLALSFMFLVARASSGTEQSADDVFGDGSGSSWLSYLVCCPLRVLVSLAILVPLTTLPRPGLSSGP